MKDSDIFGDVETKGKGDADIFVDVPQVEQPQAAPAQPAQAAPPTRQQQYEAMKSRGWGSGVPKLMYKLGGDVTDATGSPALGALVNVLPDIVQTVLSGNIAAATTKPATDWTSRFLMSSALKPTLAEGRKGKAVPAIQTMLKDGKGGLFSNPGYNPTAGGVELMKDTIAKLDDVVAKEISTSGAMISTDDVANYAAQAYPKFASGPLAKQAIDDLGKVQQEFIEHPSVMGAKQIPIQQAQQMKSGYQKAIGDKGYGLLKTPETEGEKQIARGLRELVGQARPSVVEPLKRESDIINALKMAERRVAVDANKNPIGMGWIGQPWMIPFWAWDRSALAKAVTARALANGNYPALGGAAAGALYDNPEALPVLNEYLK